MDVKGVNNSFYGKKHTTKTRELISIKRRSRRYNLLCKKCGDNMIARVHNRKYCDSCQILMDKEYMKTTDSRRSSLPKRRLQKAIIKKKYNHSPKGKLVNSLWRKTERGRANSKINNLRRRERQAGIVKEYTKQEVLEKIDKTQGICPVCKHPFTKEHLSLRELTIDHNPPLKIARVGQVYTINNLIPKCRSCNAKENQFHNKFRIPNSNQ